MIIVQIKSIIINYLLEIEQTRATPVMLASDNE